MLPSKIGGKKTIPICGAEMSVTNPSDNCRLCKASFKVKFGNLGKQSHSSSENLFKPSKQQDCFGVQLSEICQSSRIATRARFPAIFGSCLQPVWPENSQFRAAVRVCESSPIHL